MPITIDGNGTIGGITAGGLPDGTVDTDMLAANAVTEAKLGSDEQKGLAKAWVNFNGTGTVAIRESYNVSSITDNGTARYTVNFTTPMADANYVAAGFAAQQSGIADNNVLFVGMKGDLASFYTTSSFRIAVVRRDANVSDPQIVTVTFFR
jgi:hypothetical protein